MTRICAQFIEKKRRQCTKTVDKDCPHALYCMYHYKDHVDDVIAPKKDKKKKREAKECCMCKETLKDVKVTPCGHIVCFYCLTLDLLVDECPECNADISTCYSKKMRTIADHVRDLERKLNLYEEDAEAE